MDTCNLKKKEVKKNQYIIGTKSTYAKYFSNQANVFQQ